MGVADDEAVLEFAPFNAGVDDRFEEGQAECVCRAENVAGFLDGTEELRQFHLLYL